MGILEMENVLTKLKKNNTKNLINQIFESQRQRENLESRQYKNDTAHRASQ